MELIILHLLLRGLVSHLDPNLPAHGEVRVGETCLGIEKGSWSAGGVLEPPGSVPGQRITPSWSAASRWKEDECFAPAKPEPAPNVHRPPALKRAWASRRGNPPQDSLF